MSFCLLSFSLVGAGSRCFSVARGYPRLPYQGVYVERLVGV